MANPSLDVVARCVDGLLLHHADGHLDARRVVSWFPAIERGCSPLRRAVAIGLRKEACRQARQVLDLSR
jgi:hypothetical protein